MSDEFDPVEWLKQRDPIEQVQDPQDEARTRRAVFDRVIAAPTVRRRRSRRLIPVVAAAAVLTAAGSAVAAVLLNRSSSPEPGIVLCYAEARVDASRASVDRGDDPIASCERAWADPNFTEIFDNRPVPQLAACTLPSGVTAVFPADRGDPCAALGAVPAGTESPEDGKIRQFSDQVTDALDHRCMSILDVEQTVRDALRSAGLDDWSVVVAGRTPAAAGSTTEPAPSARRRGRCRRGRRCGRRRVMDTARPRPFRGRGRGAVRR